MIVLFLIEILVDGQEPTLSQSQIDSLFKYFARIDVCCDIGIHTVTTAYYFHLILVCITASQQILDRATVIAD